MQQIKLDPLIPLATTAQTGLSLKLDPAQFYPARLVIDDSPQLHIQSGHGQLQVSLSSEQVRQILRLSSAVPTAADSPDAATSGGQSLASKPASQTVASPGLTASGSASNIGHLPNLMARLQPTSAAELQLTVQTAAKTLQLPISPVQLFELLRQPPLAAGQTFSATAMQLQQSAAAVLVSASHQNGQMRIQFANQASLTLPTQQLTGAQFWPQGKPILAHLQITTAGQLTLSPAQTVSGDPAVSTRQLPARQPRSMTDVAPPVAQQLPAVQLSLKAAQQLLPQLAQAIWPERISSQQQPWLQKALSSVPQTVQQNQQQGGLLGTSPQLVDLIRQQKPDLRWQLTATSSGFTLQLQPDFAPAQLRIRPVDLSRPLTFSTPAAVHQAVSPDLSRDLWRQLLPLSPGQADPLMDSPLLPAPVRQLLQWIRQSQPDGKQVLDTPQLQQQLTAALQFQPAAPHANPNSAAGAIALAISMLLGRLAQSAAADKTPVAGKDKLAQIIGQLDNSQSSQLLKQLAGHSGQLQAAQIATLEQPANRLTEQPLFIQLPLQCGPQSRMAELCITEQESQHGPAGQRQRQWQLTMKFNLGSAGELLAKVTLRQQQISLQFYTDQTATVEMAEKFLPLLKDRLKIQGVEVTEAGCQLGRIPDHLYRQGTSLLQVRV
jgi:hypothetical protein